MLELTPENCLEYVRAQGWVGPGPARVEPLGWGVSNAVFRVESPGRSFVVKQSRMRLRTRDAWFSDLDRNLREQEVMEALADLLPGPVVPRILHHDRDNFVFAMGAAPAGSRVWKETLLSGPVDVELGEEVGRVLGMMHESTARDPGRFAGFADARNFIQLRADPFYRRVMERRPEVAEAVGEILKQMLATREALCHGDYSPKNILTHERGFTLVDYETAYFGDPTMDLGFFLSHVLLKAVKRHEIRARFFDLTRAFWRGYAGQPTFRSVGELRRRAIGHLGVCLLARVDGTSPVEYLTEPAARESVRRLGRRLLGDRPADWEQVLAACEAECAGGG